MHTTISDALTRSRLAAVLMAASLALASCTALAAEPREHPFEPARLWQVHVELTPEAYAAMQPRGQASLPGFGRRPDAALPAADAASAEEVHRNQFGVDLPWTIGRVVIGELAFPNVGIRYKGNGTIMDTGRSAKKSLKIDLDREGESQTFFGLKTINLHCGVTDPSKCRETLAYELYRDAGVPASQTALAEVSLTVPGQKNAELLGLYTMVEHVGGAFLRAHFGSDAGLLMKPEGLRDLEYLGDDWAAYESRYRPERTPAAGEANRVIEFARLVHQGDDASFRQNIDAFLDIDEYLRYLAATAFLANSDSFFVLGHNYYLYLHPETGRFHFIPWDLDRAFANFFILGSHQQQMDLSMRRPYPGSHRLTDRLLGMPEVSARYEALLAELAAGCFDRDRLLEKVRAAQAVTRDLIARDKQAAEDRQERTAAGGFGPPGMFAAPPELQTFIENRAASLAAQLAGDSEGYVPKPGFGPPGFGRPPGGATGAGRRRPPMGDMLAQPLLAALDRNRNGNLDKQEWSDAAQQLLADAQGDGDASASEQAIAKALDDRFPKPPAGGPPGPPGFTPGGMMARPIVERCDANVDGQVSMAELTSAADALFDKFDSAQQGQLDAQAFGRLLAELFSADRVGPPPREDQPRP